MNNKPLKNKSHDPGTEIVCLCNEITRSEIESAIKQGCDTLNKIFDETTAGVGPCGGSCRKFLGPMLDNYLQTGEFPKGSVRPQKIKKPRNR
ncbi:MAG: (2Fe-2S)-binding protein [Deltaproteobacteria bacterium]|nr:(2Fe-2S)-binding protein [Deltaproteobacteria bacterium]